MQPQHSAAPGHNVVDRLLDAVRGAFPDMADIVASTLRLQFGAVLEQRAPGGVHIRPDGTVRADVSDEQVAVVLFDALNDVCRRSSLADPYVEDAAARRALSNRLDVALNGAAGATGASLVKLVAQVERQRNAVHIVNFDDGMVINFRAPDGRRTTLHLERLLRDWDRDGSLSPDNLAVRDTMRAAIATYPTVGPRVPVKS